MPGQKGIYRRAYIRRCIADGFYASIWQFVLVAVVTGGIACAVYGGYHTTWTAPAAPSYHAHATTPH